MLPVRGHRPRTKIFQNICAPFAVLSIALLCNYQAAARQDVPLTLAEAEDIAIESEPGRASLEASAEAFEHESVAAGQLPDPTMRIGLANYPLESGGFTTEGMTQAQLGFRQAFPSGDSREAGTRRYESLALEMRQSADSREADVLTAVRKAWLDVYFWERTHAIVDESRPFFDDMVRVTQSLYSVGRKDQQDLLLAELELSRIDDRLLEINRQHMQAIAILSRWIGADARRPIAGKFPAWTTLPDIQSLRPAIREHALVRAADARIAAMQAGVEFAEADFKPGWAIDLGYGYRNGHLPSGDPRSDFVSLSVTVDLPYFRKNRQDRRLSAALSERRAAMGSRDRLLRELDSTLETEYVRWQDLSRRLELYESRILGQAESHAEATLTAYQSDTGDFADVMLGYINDLNTRVDHLRLEVERAQSYAVLANLGGFSR